MKVSRTVCAAGFILTAGAIAWGVLSDARETRLQELLTSIEGAENEVPYLGTRLMGGSEPVRLRILSKGGQRRVDFLGFERPSKTARPAGPRRPLAGSLPLVLRPGRDQWMRKIKDASLAVRNYDISVIGSETIAGRACQVIELRPRHGDRPSYRLAADAQNRFPLHYEVFSKGESVFETHFSDIRFDPPAPAPASEQRRRPTWLKVSQRAVVLEELGREAGFSVLRPGWLPEGFELRGSEIVSVRAEISRELRETLAPFLPFPLPKLEVAVVHLTYTDGLAAIAVVECSASSELWQSLRMFIPGTPSKIAGSRVVARRFSDRSGSAYLLEVGDTVVLVAGNVDSGSMEWMIRTLERRE